MSNTELHHLLNRAIDGVVLHGESDRLRELVRELEADRERVHERACRLAERLRNAEAEREQLRTIARTHWDTTERVRALHDSLAREDMLASPEDLIARGRAAENIAAALDGWSPTALDQPQQPTTTTTTTAPPCSARVPAPLGGTPLRTCDLPAGHAGWHHDAQHEDRWVFDSPDSWQSSTTTTEAHACCTPGRFSKGAAHTRSCPQSTT